nr:aminotransferase class I/II-fold pyridoxal phosphate-dependent enzyme [uncultured Cohaesibacter sp.]
MMNKTIPLDKQPSALHHEESVTASQMDVSMYTDQADNLPTGIDASGDNETARTILQRHFKNAHVHYGTGWSSALYTALLACHVAPGDDVIIPALAPAGIVHAILLAKAHPVLVDVRADTRLIDHDAVMGAITERTRCVVLCHLYGQVASHQALHEQLKARSIALIEDGSDAFLSLGQSDSPASHCDLLVGCLPGWRDVEGELPSFILTRNQDHHARLSYWTAQHDIADRLFQSIEPEAEEAPYVDLIGQLTGDQDHYFQNCISYSLNTQSVIKKQVALYDDHLAQAGLQTLMRSEECIRILQSYPVCLEPFKRASLFESLYDAGFQICQSYRSLNKLKFFFSQESVGNFPNAASWSDGAISLPTGNHLSGREQKQMIATIERFKISTTDPA